MDLTPLVLVIDDTPQNARLLEAMLWPRDSGPPRAAPVTSPLAHRPAVAHVLFRGGTVFEGTGSPLRETDVVVGRWNWWPSKLSRPTAAAGTEVAA
jgi:hypothetical protein